MRLSLLYMLASALVAMIFTFIVHYLLERHVTTFTKAIRKRFLRISFWFEVALLGSVIFFVADAFRQSLEFEHIDFTDKAESVPNYLMLFTTIASVYLLFRTLTNQNNATQKSEFENRFFKFIDYHRENVAQMKYRDPEVSRERYISDTAVFTTIYYEVQALYKDYLKKLPVKTKKDRMEAINFVYLTIFYGNGKAGLDILEKKFGQEKIAKLGLERRTAKYSGRIFCRAAYYTGHVRRLGHYYRNIYQAIDYLNKQAFLTPDEKYEYATLFRTQMSVYEQTLFFINSLSSLGSKWELGDYSRRFSPEEAGELWITKYDLILNETPHDGEILPGITIKEFYPLVTMEGEEECAISGTLPFAGNGASICRFCFNKRYIKNTNSDEYRKIFRYFGAAGNSKAIEDFSCSIPRCKATRYLRAKESLGWRWFRWFHMRL